MLYEFAVDPEVLSTWESFRYFIDRFGVHQGRMISRFPKHWKRLVYDSLRCQPVERLRIVEILNDRIDSKLLNTKRPYNGELSWLTNAETAHARQPFRAIIASTNPRNLPGILIADECDETRDERSQWVVHRSDRVSRKANAFLGAAGALLSFSSDLILVDPYFNPAKIEFRNPLQEFVRAIAAKGVPRRLEYHLRADYANAPASQYFQNVCKTKLPQILPAGTELKIVRWKEKAGGREFHARYLLTNLGGITFDPGLDEGDDGQLTKVDLLEPQIYLGLIRDFPLDADTAVDTTYEFSDQIIIAGTAK